MGKKYRAESIRWEEVRGRMRQARGEITQKELAEALGYRQSDISDWESGKRRPPVEYLHKLAEATHLSVDWLVTGNPAAVSSMKQVRGRMLHATLDELIRQEEERGRGGPRGGGGGPRAAVELPGVAIITADRWHKRLIYETGRGDFYGVPLLTDAIKAGDPASITETDIEGIALIHRTWCDHPESTYALRVRGDSMIPTIPDGSIVTVDTSQIDPARIDGKVAAVCHDDGCTIKRIRVIEGGEILCNPDNVTADNRAFVLCRERGDRILGRVISMHARMD